MDQLRPAALTDRCAIVSFRQPSMQKLTRPLLLRLFQLFARASSPLPPAAMPLIYSLVSRSIHVLAEYTASGLTGNFSTVSRVLLKKIPEQDNKCSSGNSANAHLL